MYTGKLRIPTNRFCFRCNSRVYHSDVKGYPYVCYECDENMFTSETYKSKDKDSYINPIVYAMQKRKMIKTRKFLEENWEVSSYNEDTEEQLDYYINERQCEIGDKAYIYYYEEDELSEVEIVHIISRSNDMDFYDELIKDDEVLINGEDEYNADTSAEFITDNDCYLVWFKYV